jgi:hypothetical protein
MHGDSGDYEKCLSLEIRFGCLIIFAVKPLFLVEFTP